MYRWTGLITPANRHFGYGKPVSVLAETEAEAHRKVLTAYGWRGNESTCAKVRFDRMDEEEN